MKFDYDRVDWQFLSNIMQENARRISRTYGGVSDTSASSDKWPLLLEGDALRERTAQNEDRVYQLIFETRKDTAPTDAKTVQDLLFSIADLTNEGLLPEGRLRSWSVSYPNQPFEDDGYRPAPNRSIPPAALPTAITQFCETVHSRWSELGDDPVPLAAWTEWHLNAGPLHPFYDGCGRISKSFAALVLVRCSYLPPLYDTRKEYFDHANRGPAKFIDYYRARIDACWTWIDHQRDLRL